MAERDPILIDCEGSESYTAGRGKSDICAMCGEHVPLDGVGLTVPHQRKDILAMVDRGDFG